MTDKKYLFKDIRTNAFFSYTGEPVEKDEDVVETLTKEIEDAGHSFEDVCPEGVVFYKALYEVKPQKRPIDVKEVK
jgi:hypothetical protein